MLLWALSKLYSYAHNVYNTFKVLTIEIQCTVDNKIVLYNRFKIIKKLSFIKVKVLNYDNEIVVLKYGQRTNVYNLSVIGLHTTFFI